MSSGLANIDLVEVLFTLFWVFFIGLVYYLQREMKREGYPLVSDRSKHITVQGFPAIPSPKEYRLESGRTVSAPRDEPPEEAISAEPAALHPGAPLDPTGDPLVAAVGPGAYANRPDIAETTLEGTPRIVPMRANGALHVDSRDTDPRGLALVAADGETVGEVTDLWIDLAEPQIYFLEVKTTGDDGGRSVMVPFGFAEVDKQANKVRVNALYSDQFANVPGLSSPDEITLLEEDKIMGYFGGGLMFADDKRAEPYF
jgi:photosynthetic reaction center H subunit